MRSVEIPDGWLRVTEPGRKRAEFAWMLEDVGYLTIQPVFSAEGDHFLLTVKTTSGIVVAWTQYKDHSELDPCIARVGRELMEQKQDPVCYAAGLAIRRVQNYVQDIWRSDLCQTYQVQG